MVKRAMSGQTSPRRPRYTHDRVFEGVSASLRVVPQSRIVGAGLSEDLLAAIPYTDLFLYDCKMIPGEECRRYIGALAGKLETI